MPLLVNRIKAEKPKYAMMNYVPTKYDSAGNVSTLHIEARYLDGNLSPSIITAHACLLYGLMLKAVEISRHGLLKAGTPEYMDKQAEIYNELCNGDGSYQGARTSDNSNLSPYISDLQEQSLQLIRLVKHTLSRLSPADSILNSLAIRPAAFRLIEGEGWEDIERSLHPKPATKANTELQKTMQKLVNLGSINDCDSEEEWIKTVAEYLASKEGGAGHVKRVASLQHKINNIMKETVEARQVYWSSSIGSFLTN